MTNSLLRPSPQTRCDWKSLCSRGSRLASKSGRCSSRQGRQTKPTPWTVAHSSALSIETITLSPCKTGDETANPGSRRTAALSAPGVSGESKNRPHSWRPGKPSLSRHVRGHGGRIRNSRSPSVFVATASQLCHGGLGIAHHGCANALEKLVRGRRIGRAHPSAVLAHKVKNVFASASTNANNPCWPIRRLRNFSGHAIQTRGHSLLRRFRRHCPYHRDRLPGPKRADPQGCLPQNRTKQGRHRGLSPRHQGCAAVPP